MIAADSFCRAARPHESDGFGCQDSAEAHCDERGGFAVLCDGCSSSRFGALGAQLLSRAAANAWASQKGAQAELSELARRALASQAAALAAVGVAPAEALCTLLMALADADGRCSLLLWGDGFVGVASPAGSRALALSGESLSNMPSYPAYAVVDGAQEALVRAGGGTVWRGSMQLREGVGPWFEASASLEPGESLCLCSDGLGSVPGWSAEDFFVELSGAKGPGRFMGRRARKVLSEIGREGLHLGDDFSIACLRREVDQ